MKRDLEDSPGSCIATTSAQEQTEKNLAKRVQFAPINHDNDTIKVINSPAGYEIVRRMSWTDHKGATGRYTGRVNDRMQPHGRGVMVYNHRTFNTCIWVNGVPTKSWTPTTKHHNQASLSKRKQHCNDKKQNPSVKNSTYLSHLELGDTATSKDMMAPQPHSSQIDTLRVHDFVFILRSDKQWTYAIVADRKENLIQLEVDTAGSMKVISRRNWSTSLRLVRPKKMSKGVNHSVIEPVSGADDGMMDLIDSLPPPTL